MKYRTGLKADVCARFLMAGAVLSLAVIACDDSEDRLDDEGSQAGSAGKPTGTAGSTSGSGGVANGGAGGEATEGGSAGSVTVGGAGAGGEPSSEAGAGGAVSGGAGEGGQGGAPSEEDKLVVFGDAYATDVGFVAFGGSVNDLSVDGTTAHTGTASLKVAVPAAGYTGGALVSATDRDLSAYNAVSFWAKASVAHDLNVFGLANDAGANTALQVERNAVPLTTEWQHFVLPIPTPSKLDAQKGLFHFAEGAEAAAYTVWLDDIEYVTAELGAPAPAIATATRNVTVGGTFPIEGTAVSYTIDGTPTTFSVKPNWFDYVSVDEAVASVSTAGLATAEGVGATTITAELNGIAAAGLITVNVSAVTVPVVAAPTPVLLPINVISLFSDAYTNVAVSTWSAGWDAADIADVSIVTNATKLYTNLTFAGVEFTAPTIDATAMTHLHVDVWLPIATSFSVKLVDFGANGIYQGAPNDDTEFNVSKTGLTTKTWQSLEFALADFTGMNRAHLAQMIITSDAAATVYFDNMYFHN